MKEGDEWFCGFRYKEKWNGCRIALTRKSVVVCSIIYDKMVGAPQVQVATAALVR